MKRLAVILLLAGCAKVVSLSGGPEDVFAPEITAVFPEQGFVDTVPGKIEFIFSEKLAADEQLISLFPGIDGEVKVDGSRVTVFPGENSGVVVVTLSGNIADRRGNRTASPETFVWNSIPADSFASVSVSVFRDGGGAVTSGARCEFFLLPDTAGPTVTHFPDTLGFVSAGWLSEGSYRICCYEDDDMSRTWDPDREPGVFQNLDLEPGDQREIAMTMTIVDSIGPRISDVSVTDGWHLDILWNEQLNLAAGEENQVSITGPDSLSVVVYGVKNFQGRSTTGRLTVYTGELSDTLYTIAVHGIHDLAGNPSLPDTLTFWGSDSLPETVFDVQYTYPGDGAIDIPAAGPFEITFTDWVDLDALDSLYTVTRVADSTGVPGELARTSSTAFSFTPHNELLGERQYRVDLLPGIVSLRGDTINGQSWTFAPSWSDCPGFVSGVITGTGASVVTVVVSPAGSAGETMTGEYVPGDYLFSGVPGGRYTVSVFVDWNSDEIWNPGEPYGAWPGIVEVYPGIETEQIDIQVVP